MATAEARRPSENAESHSTRAGNEDSPSYQARDATTAGWSEWTQKAPTGQPGGPGETRNWEVPAERLVGNGRWLADLPRDVLPPDAAIGWARQDLGLEYRPEPGWSFRVQARGPEPGGRAPGYVYELAYREAETMVSTPAGDLPYASYSDTSATWSAADGALLSDDTKHSRTTPQDPVAPRPAPAAPSSIRALETESHLAPAAGALGLALLVIAFWRRVATLAAMGAARLYAKIRPADVLAHPRRSQLLEAVQQDPGMLLDEARKRVRLGWGPFLHHLLTLEANGHVVSVKLGKERCLFVPGSYHHSDLAAVALLRIAAARRVWDAVQGRPGVNQRDLSADLGLTHATVHFHARRLERAGLLEGRRDGRLRRYYARPPPRRAS